MSVHFFSIVQRWASFFKSMAKISSVLNWKAKPSKLAYHLYNLPNENFLLNPPIVEFLRKEQFKQFTLMSEKGTLH